MTDPPESASDEQPDSREERRHIVGPVDTFQRVDPVDEPRSGPVGVGGDEGAVASAVPSIISRDEIEALRANEPIKPDDARGQPDDAPGETAGPGKTPRPGDPQDVAVAVRPDRGASAWWRFGFPVVLTLLVLAIPALVWAGSRILLDSDDGRVVSAVTDPAAPGWEAVVDPTPVHTIAVSNAEGGLDHVAFQFLTGSVSGGVVVVPPETVFSTDAYGDIPLSTIFENGGGATGGGAEAIRGALQSIVGIGIDEVDVVEPSEWSELVGPVAPITVSNPDDVATSDAQGQTLTFPKGSIQVAADEVWPYLSAQDPSEDAINRMFRIEAFWRGWLGAVNAAGDAPGSVPGEIDSGLGYFVRSLAKGATEVTTLPVASITGPEGEAWFDPQEEEVRLLIASLDPYPAGPVGERLRLRVLDGTGELDHGLGAAKVLAANGGQIDKVGNALDFDHQSTEFVYYDPALEPMVQELRNGLGTGELVLSEELNVSEDVTVVLGQDYLAIAWSIGEHVCADRFNGIAR